MANSDWIKVLYHEEAPHGGGVQLVTSPYDIPEAFKIADIRKNWIRIEFRYIDSAERGEEVSLPSSAKVVVGRASKRLLAIEMNPAHHDVGDIISSFDRIIDQLSTRKEFRPQANWNYRATKRAFDQSSERWKPSLSSFFLATA